MERERDMEPCRVDDEDESADTACWYNRPRAYKAGAATAAPAPYGLRATLPALGEACALGGELGQAAELYRAVIGAEGVELIDKGNALLGRAQLAYEWNRLDAAEQDAQAAYQIYVVHPKRSSRTRHR